VNSQRFPAWKGSRDARTNSRSLYFSRSIRARGPRYRLSPNGDCPIRPALSACSAASRASFLVQRRGGCRGGPVATASATLAKSLGIWRFLHRRSFRAWPKGHVSPPLDQALVQAMACEVVAETELPLSRQSLADLVRRAQATLGKKIGRTTKRPSSPGSTSTGSSRATRSLLRRLGRSWTCTRASGKASRWGRRITP
jgi:hypothetical protein